VRHAPPQLGEATDEILGEWLGLDAARLEQLKQRGVTGAV
jgi:crotonobetainyl-CoA:carnitine CoA-transferase CaiB-like acyl-CoA transferase